MQVQITIRTPNHIRQSGPWGDLILLSHTFPVVPQHVDENVVESLMANHGHEWSAILVKRSQGANSIFLWRSLTSSFDLFYTIEGSKRYVSDSFAGCVLNLPPQARVPSRDAIIDHFLFRTVPAENSYCEKVRRTGHGMQIEFDLSRESIQKQQFARYARRPHIDSESVSLKEIDNALEAATADVRGGQHALLFSGGVDSTLLATYLTENPLQTNIITSPEFEIELKYARHAARLLGREIQVNLLPEADYLRRMEEVIDRMAMPSHHAQTVILSEAFEGFPKGFVTGEFADGLFGGFRMGIARYGAKLANPAIATTLRVMSLLPLSRIRNAAKLSRELHTPPPTPGSIAFRSSQYGRLPTYLRFFSRSEIERRLIARYEYISQFLDFEFVDRTWCTYLEAGQKTSFFCEDVLSAWRQLASSYGKTVYSPFVAQQLYDTAMSIRLPLRYTDGRVTKHLLKKLLTKRLPTYPINQRKLSGVVPIPRYTSSGPLEHWQEQYPPPDFIDAATLDEMHKNDQGALLHTLIYSVWRSRISKLNSAPIPALSIEV
jgi:asparagine synthase (glutamine-hydrolysing)